MSEELNISVVSVKAIDVARYGNNQSDVNSEQAGISERDGSGVVLWGGEDDRCSHSPEGGSMNGSDGRVDKIIDDNMSKNSSS